MGQNDAHHILFALDQPSPVRKDQIDAQHLLFGEHQAAVDDCELAVDLEGGAVAPDPTKAAEEGDLDGHG